MNDLSKQSELSDPSESSIRDKATSDREWVEKFYTEHWGAPRVVSRGVMYEVVDLPGLVAERGGEPCGLLHYHHQNTSCQIVTIDAMEPYRGIGTLLIDALIARLRPAGCQRLWLITTNDNLSALRFYQRREFALVAVHPRAIEESRRLKPSIPMHGLHGIPIRDELELERML